MRGTSAKTDTVVVPAAARLARFARLAGPKLRAAATNGLGIHALRNRSGPGLEFLHLADYSPGEDLRRIDWRRSASRGRAVLRHYRDESAADWTLCCDVSASMTLGRKWPMTAELAAALAYALLHNGHRVALLLFAGQLQDECPPGRGARQFARISHTLRNARPLSSGGSSHPAVCLPRLGPGGNLVVIGDCLRADGMQPDLRQLRRAAASLAVIQVLAETEHVLHGDGTSELVDIEGGERFTVNTSPRQVAAVNDALAAYCKQLQAFCRSLSMPASLCHDRDDWERTLLAHLGI